MSIIVATSENRKSKRRKKHFLCEEFKAFRDWLRPIVSSLDCGKNKKRFNTNAKVMCLLNKEPYNGKQAWLYKPSNLDWQLHFTTREREHWLYAAGAKPTKTLFMIDIDVDKKLHLGSIAGAKACLEAIETRHFAGKYLHWEHSRSDKGITAYIVLEAPGFTAKAVNNLYKQLEDALQPLVDEFDVEGIEVKGNLPELTWQYGKLVHYKAGALFGLPKDPACMQTVSVRVNDLAEIISSYPEYVPEKKKRSGSLSGMPFSDEVAASIPKAQAFYRQHANYAFAVHIPGARAVQAKHFQNGLTVLSLIALHPNEDNQLPNERVRAYWNNCYKKGYFDTKFNAQQWKVVRDNLNRLGFLDMFDNTYHFFTDGRLGEAMKWQLKAEFCFDFCEEHTPPHLLAHGFIPPAINHNWLAPELVFPANEYGDYTSDAEKLWTFMSSA